MAEKNKFANSFSGLLQIEGQLKKKQSKLFYNKKCQGEKIKRLQCGKNAAFQHMVDQNLQQKVNCKKNNINQILKIDLKSRQTRIERYSKSSPRGEKQNFPISINRLEFQANIFKSGINSERYQPIPLSNLNIFHSQMRKIKTGVSIKRRTKSKPRELQLIQKEASVEFNNEILSKTFRCIDNRPNKKCFTSFDEEPLITITGFRAPQIEIMDHFKLKGFTQTKRIKKSVTQNNFYY